MGYCNKQQAEVSIPNSIMTTEADLPLSEAVPLATEGYKILREQFAELFRMLKMGRKLDE